MFKEKERPILYFAGCTALYRQTEIAHATVKIMRSAGIDLTIMNEEVCCGSVFFRTGFIDLAKELAVKNIAKIRETGAKTLLTSCAGCYQMLKSDYASFIEGELVDFEVEIFHIVQLLSRLIESRDLKFTAEGGAGAEAGARSELKVKVSYHDPCHLGRGCEIYEEPRKILEQIPDIELVEMEWIKDKSYCCGSGAGLRALSEGLAVSVARRRLDDAVNKGAEVIVSACPFCKHNLSDSAMKYGIKIDVKDITEIVAERIL
ncbi:MAG: hypothetical protein H0M93_03355 [Methanophagales archaeon]|nr:hypothetical protein [Methanophagales archaeon]